MQQMTTSQGTSTALVHSVVVLNISDQWTRTYVQNGTAQTVCGALIGKQAGRNIEIWNSFELKSSFTGGTDDTDEEKRQLLIDQQYFDQRIALYKETFADLDFLGFYVTGAHERVTGGDVSLQRQAHPYNESPFLLKFNPESPVISDKVAINVFDSSVDPSDEHRLIFQPIPVKIVSEMAEQIGLDHVARYSKAGTTTESTVSKHMGPQFGAINTFLQGLTVAYDYIMAIQQGQLERDETILREINKLCLKLSIYNSAQLQEDLEHDNLQNSDHKLLALLSSICSAQGAMYQLVEKVNVLAREYLHRERSSIIQSSSMFGGGRALHPGIGGTHFPRFLF